MEEPKITVVGSINMDIVVRTTRFPKIGETISGKDLNMVPGGKGANQAVAAARQGANVVMVGRLGKDTFRDSLLNSLIKESIDTNHVATDPEVSSGIALITVSEEGENYIIIIDGANGRVSPGDVEKAEKSIANSDALIVQLEIPIPSVSRAITIARENSTKVILNAAPAKKLPTEILGSIDFLIVNENEASFLSGSTSVNPREIGEALRKIVSCPIIITLGEQGTMLFEKNKATHFPGFRVSVVDTTAAGDAFVGAFTLAFSLGKSLGEAIHWANATGALATTILGAQPSLPTFNVVNEFISRRRPAQQ